MAFFFTIECWVLNVVYLTCAANIQHLTLNFQYSIFIIWHWAKAKDRNLTFLRRATFYHKVSYYSGNKVSHKNEFPNLFLWNTSCNSSNFCNLIGGAAEGKCSKLNYKNYRRNSQIAEFLTWHSPDTHLTLTWHLPDLPPMFKYGSSIVHGMILLPYSHVEA